MIIIGPEILEDYDKIDAKNILELLRMTIKSESEFRKCQEAYEAIIQKGTALGDMELLGSDDKTEFVRLSQIIREWEATHYPLPTESIPQSPIH